MLTIHQLYCSYVVVDFLSTDDYVTISCSRIQAKVCPHIGYTKTGR